jgi:hypothetical protein
MKYLRFLMAWFNYHLNGWMTNPRKVDRMKIIYKEQLEQARKELSDE